MADGFQENGGGWLKSMFAMDDEILELHQGLIAGDIEVAANNVGVVLGANGEEESVAGDEVASGRRVEEAADEGVGVVQCIIIIKTYQLDILISYNHFVIILFDFIGSTIVKYYLNLKF